MNIRLYMVVPQTEALGPGKRFAIWVQGCNKRCKGCIAPDAWNFDGGYEKDLAELADEIINTPDIEGITISGGEPFLQQAALCELIKRVKMQRDLGIIVYTGLLYNDIANTELASLSDIIIDGEYVDALNDNKSLRGSFNQNAVCLTQRYNDLISDYYGVDGRKMEFVVSNGTILLVGIPPISIETIISSSYDFAKCDEEYYKKLKFDGVISAPFWNEYASDEFYEVILFENMPIALINYEYNDGQLVIKLFEVRKDKRLKNHGFEIIKKFLSNKKKTTFTIPIWSAVEFWRKCGFDGNEIGMIYKYEE